MSYEGDSPADHPLPCFLPTGILKYCLLSCVSCHFLPLPLLPIRLTTLCRVMPTSSAPAAVQLGLSHTAVAADLLAGAGAAALQREAEEKKGVWVRNLGQRLEEAGLECHTLEPRKPEGLQPANKSLDRPPTCRPPRSWAAALGYAQPPINHPRTCRPCNRAAVFVMPYRPLFITRYRPLIP